MQIPACKLNMTEDQLKALPEKNSTWKKPVPNIPEEPNPFD